MITVWDWPGERTNWSGEIVNTGFCKWLEHDLCGYSTRSAYSFRYNTIALLPYNGPKANQLGCTQHTSTTMKNILSFALHYALSSCSYLSQVSVIIVPSVLAGPSEFGCGKSLSSPWKRLDIHMYIYMHTYTLYIKCITYTHIQYHMCVHTCSVGDWLCCTAWWYAWSSSDLSWSAQVSEGELFVARLASIVNS